MKKSCGLLVGLWLVLAGAYAAVAWWRTQEALPAVVIGILGGTFAAMLVGSAISLFGSVGDRAALRRAQSREPRVDGRLEAASGHIRPLGDALVAPFSGTSCVAYEYDVKEARGGRSAYAGVALAPCVIDTSTGPVRLLGWSALDEFARGPDEIDRERGAAYFRNAPFEQLGLSNALALAGSLLAGDDGSIRKDLRMEGADVDLEGKTITEKLVPVGAKVTALGTWSAARGGLVPSGATMLRLFPTGIKFTAEDLTSASRRNFAIACGFFLALHAILVPMYLLSPGPPPRDRAGQPVPRNPSVWDERDCIRLRDLLAAGADPNEPGAGGRTPLMNAVANGKIECVKTLVEAGARPDTPDEDGSSAMSWAITAEREDLVAVLKAGGGTDFRVTAQTGRPLSPDDGPVRAVEAYLAAIQTGDLAALERVSSPSTPALIRRHDVLGLWQRTRPAAPGFVSGFWNDDSATLAVRGATAASRGGAVVFHYHLKRQPDGWHVDKEGFDDEKTEPVPSVQPPARTGSSM
ncbi:MAG TPA: ankyrin repeat domain-containing protein [Thermoanaerobaculia bacterium]|nr:ankyrin repeat domain-containing protein [Thermoanaerobaculia bacterium]